MAAPQPSRWRLYLALTKPRVVALIVLTAVVGTLLATPGLPPLDALIWGNLGIGLAAASAADAEPDSGPAHRCKMARTRTRPLPTGGLTERQALISRAALGVASMLILWPAGEPADGAADLRFADRLRRGLHRCG